MAWTKSPDALVAQFERVVSRFPDAQRRKMFGYPAAFVGGNMVTSLHQSDWIVRLGPEALAEARTAGAGPFDPMGGRPMKSYATLPAAVLESDEATAAWVERAVEHGRSLPPKK